MRPRPRDDHIFNALQNIYDKRNNFNLTQITGNFTEGFAPPRINSHVSWYVCGSDFMEAAADAMEDAKESIFITDWQITSGLHLKRPWSESDNAFVPSSQWRLDNLLKRKAEMGVRIYIMLYQDPE